MIVTILGSSDLVAVTLWPYPRAEPIVFMLDKFVYVTFSAKAPVSVSKVSFSFARGKIV